MKNSPEGPCKAMKRKLSAIFFIIIFSSCAHAAVFSGANVPFDSSFHLGLVNGPGTGVSIGADMFLPAQNFYYGAEIEQQVTNSDFQQNINILKYGLALKYVFNDDLFFTIHIGRASFYITQLLSYHDSFSGAEYEIDEDTHGSATYIAFAPNFLVGDFFLTPKIVLNNIADGGTIAEFDLNVGHKF
jgi:hypothetical protein